MAVIPANAPVRSPDQRLEALAKANDTRVKRAQLKKDLKSGAVSITETIRRPPGYVANMKVFDLLINLPKFGGVKAGRCLNACRVSQAKTIGGLSGRQRAEVINWLESR